MALSSQGHAITKGRDGATVLLCFWLQVHLSSHCITGLPSRNILLVSLEFLLLQATPATARVSSTTLCA